MGHLVPKVGDRRDATPGRRLVGRVHRALLRLVERVPVDRRGNRAREQRGELGPLRGDDDPHRVLGETEIERVAEQREHAADVRLALASQRLRAGEGDVGPKEQMVRAEQVPALGRLRRSVGLRERHVPRRRAGSRPVGTARRVGASIQSRSSTFTQPRCDAGLRPRRAIERGPASRRRGAGGHGLLARPASGARPATARAEADGREREDRGERGSHVRGRRTIPACRPPIRTPGFPARRRVDHASLPKILIATNRKARHDFSISHTVEAGLVLCGSEAKSLRSGGASLQDGYARLEQGELWLYGVHIPPLPQASYFNHEPRRKRKCLVHRREIEKLGTLVEGKGTTIVPLSLYFPRLAREGRARRRARQAAVRQARGHEEAHRRARRAPRDAPRIGRLSRRAPAAPDDALAATGLLGRTPLNGFKTRVAGLRPAPAGLASASSRSQRSTSKHDLARSSGRRRQGRPRAPRPRPPGLPRGDRVTGARVKIRLLP